MSFCSRIISCFRPLFSFLSHFPFLFLLSLSLRLSRSRTSGDPLSRVSSRVRSCIPLTLPFNLIRRADLQLKFLSDVFSSRRSRNRAISKLCRRGKIDKDKFCDVYIHTYAYITRRIYFMIIVLW